MANPNRTTPLVSPGMPGIPFPGYGDANAVMDLVEQVTGRNPRPITSPGMPGNVFPGYTEMPSVRRMEPLQATRIPPRRAMPMFADRSLAGTGVGGGLPPLPGGPPPVPGVPNAKALVHVPGLGSSMSAAEILAAQAGGAKTGAGSRMSGLLGGAKGALNKVGNNPLAAKYNSLGMVGKGAVGLGVGIGGNMLGDALGGNDTVQGRFTKGAATWGPLGLIAGPKGAAVAGLVGGIGNVIFGDDDGGSGKLEDRVREYLSTAGADADTQGSILSLYELEKDALGEEVAKTNLMSRVGAFEQESMLAQQQEQENAIAQQRMLASQALAGQFFAPFAQQMVQSAQQRHAMLQNILPTLPENFRGVAAAQSAAALDNATRMATAYQAQAQMIPAMASFQQQQDQVNSLAAQLQQQGMQQVLQPQASNDLMSLLQGG